MPRTVDQNTLRQMDWLADLMADGCPTIVEAAYRMRITQTAADRMWQRVRRGLGSQAQ